MFIIARRRGQRIAIGDDIEVTVTEISRTTVKLGVLAPKSCSIIRSELKDSVEQANREAMHTNLSIPDGIQLSYDAPRMETNLAGANSFFQAPVKTLAVLDVNRSTIDHESRKS
jgi:carbon storage regulator